MLFERNCGATIGFSTQISIVSANGSPSGGGNIYIANGGPTPAPWGGPWANMRWLAADRLEISYDPASQIFLQKSQVDGVSIDWRTASSPKAAP